MTLGFPKFPQMETNKPPIHPLHRRYPQSPPLSAAPPADSRRLDHGISGMPEIPGLPDDTSFDAALGIVGNDCEGEKEEDLVSLYFDIERFGELSMSNENENEKEEDEEEKEEEKEKEEEGETGIRHQHSQSMDGLISINASESSGSGSSKLPELAVVDPKRAKRLSANRQSAVRSKERKVRYVSQLERDMKALEIEKATVSTQLAMLQRDTSEMSIGNNALKLHLHNMAQKNQLRAAFNDKLKEEIEHLKLMTGENIAVPMMNFGPSQVPNQPFYPSNHSMQNLMPAHQLQQLQIQSLQSDQLLHQLLASDVNFNGSFPYTQVENSADNYHSANGLIN